MKKVLKGVGIFLLVIVIIVALFFAFLTITQLNPKRAKATKAVGENSTATIAPGSELKIMSWNVGYAALGEESDFFMDGGKTTRPESISIINKNLDGIINKLTEEKADFTMLQEVDSGSKRSYNVKETELIGSTLGQNSAYALNYKCAYVPYPFPSTLGKVSSGLFTLATTDIKDATRVALPSPFKWPVAVANLKRCLLVSRIPLDGTDKELVLINLHLEAYDDGEGKKAQTKVLNDFITAEYEKGNYVIAGGDFNQTFPGALENYPVYDPDFWLPGELEETMLPEGWTMAYDASQPTCRSLRTVLDLTNEKFQFYVIDGFLLSPNVELKSVKTDNIGFKYSDHNPVIINVVLKDS